MNSKKIEPKYFYGEVISPYDKTMVGDLLKELIDYCYTGSIAWGHELCYSYTDYKYSTVNYGLFGRLSRQIKEEVVKCEYFPIIVEKKENCYVDVISGEIYKSPAEPGQIALGTYRDVDTIWLANYLKGMTKEKVDIYVRLMDKLKKAVYSEYCKKLSEETKLKNKYDEADNYINAFRKKYNR